MAHAAGGAEAYRPDRPAKVDSPRYLRLQQFAIETVLKTAEIVGPIKATMFRASPTLSFARCPAASQLATHPYGRDHVDDT